MKQEITFTAKQVGERVKERRTELNLTMPELGKRVGVNKSTIQIRIMVVPEQVSDDDMVLMARDISKQIEFELEYPGQIKVNVIRESRVTDYAK